MDIETFEKAKKVLDRDEHLTKHLRDLDEGLLSDIPIAVRKLGGKEVYLKPEFFDFKEFIEGYKANVFVELQKLNVQFEQIK